MTCSGRLVVPHALLQCFHTVHLPAVPISGNTILCHAQSSTPRLLPPTDAVEHLPSPAGKCSAGIICHILRRRQTPSVCRRRPLMHCCCAVACRIQIEATSCRLRLSRQLPSLPSATGTCRLPVRRRLTSPAWPSDTCCLPGARHSPAAALIRPFPTYELPDAEHAAQGALAVQ